MTGPRYKFKLGSLIRNKWRSDSLGIIIERKAKKATSQAYLTHHDFQKEYQVMWSISPAGTREIPPESSWYSEFSLVAVK